MCPNKFDSLYDHINSLPRKCSKCKKEVSLDWTHCGYCGHNLSEIYDPDARICPDCGTLVKKDWSHCTNCGSFVSKKSSLLTSKICPKCHRSNSESSVLCAHCRSLLVEEPLIYPDLGKKLQASRIHIPVQEHIGQRLCPKCDIYLDKDQKCCPQCGQSVPDFIMVGEGYRVNRLGIPASSEPSIIISRKTSTTSDNSGNSGICFIATACDSDEPTLATFYAFRDQVLLRSPFGQKLVRLYYHYAPPLADFIRSSDWLKTMIRTVILKPLAYGLRTVVLCKSLEKVEG